MIIKIKNLRLQPIIGVYKHERITKQELLVNIEIEYDAKSAIASDNLADALDYDLIKAQIIALADDSRFHLIERMADQVMAILMTDDRIERATVEIDKPEAIQEAESVSFTITKKR